VSLGAGRVLVARDVAVAGASSVSLTSATTKAVLVATGALLAVGGRSDAIARVPKPQHMQTESRQPVTTKRDRRGLPVSLSSRSLNIRLATPLYPVAWRLPSGKGIIGGLACRATKRAAGSSLGPGGPSNYKWASCPPTYSTVNSGSNPSTFAEHILRT
jgi:hypothetical protein